MKSLSLRTLMLLNISLGALAVVLGALGNHLSLQNIDSTSINSFEIAQRYHMFHVLVGLIEGLIIGFGVRDFFIKTSMVFFVLGVLFFCGSLYTHFFFHIDFFKVLTPIGGFFFLLGWVTLLSAFATREKIV
ncbi:DUF423 domain-containing protein [Gammaproteobacteria bacterium]|nr:DUF423 domain-containing protein [Gammaproteobacteria bacterium]